MNNGDTGNRGVMSALNGLHNNCSPSNAETPTLVRSVGALVVGVADSKIKRYYLAREARKKNLAIAKGRSPYDERIAQEFYTIANGIFRLQVWLQYPELIGRPIVAYDDWSIGPEMPDAETRDLFNPFEAKGLAERTRDVRSARADTDSLAAFCTTVSN